MPGITDMGLTFNMPNFNGSLYAITPEDTPFTSAIGVMSGGGEAIYAKDFEWQTYDLRSPENPSNLEGQAAPQARERTRLSVDNVAQIFHSQVSVSYTKGAATAQRNGLNNVQPTAQAQEMGWQVTQELKSLKRDMEWTFIHGIWAKPANNASARKTRGIMQAITTNVASGLTAAVAATATAASDLVNIASHGFANGDRVQFSSLTGGAGLVVNTSYYVRDVTAGTFKVSLTLNGTPVDVTTDATAGTNLVKLQLLTEQMVIDLMQMVWENGGIQETGTATLMVGAAQKRRLTKIFVTDKGYTEETRTVGGVSCSTILTDFGTLNIMLNRHMAPDAVAVLSLEVCKPRLLLIPGKGFLFLEELAKVGASDQAQLYGEIGLEYGNERQHGKITGLQS